MIQQWKTRELSLVQQRCTTPENTKEYIAYVEQQAKRKEAKAISLWSTEFYLNNPQISPLRGALAVWGLSIDDLGVASFHGTGTKANDFNESMVTHDQLSHLGRRKGNAMFTIFQKHLTGHPKGEYRGRYFKMFFLKNLSLFHRKNCFFIELPRNRY